MTVRPFVCMYQQGSDQTDFCEILYVETCMKTCQNSPNMVKTGENIGQFP